MKNLYAWPLLLGAALTAHGQGLIHINNHVPGRVVAAVFGPDPADSTRAQTGNTITGYLPGGTVYGGVPLDGTNFLAELWAGPQGTPENLLIPVPGSKTTIGTGVNAGFFAPTFTVAVPNVPPGQRAQLQVRTWDSLGGTVTSDAAAATSPGVARGKSLSFVSAPLGGAAGPARLDGLASFNLHFAECIQPPAGLVDWWPFDEAPSAVPQSAHDIGGATNNDSLLSVFGAVPAPGLVGNAISFNGTTAFLQVPDHPEINFYGACGALGVEDFTLDVWVKLNATNSTQMLLDKRTFISIGGQTCFKGYALAVANGQLVFQMATGAGSPCQDNYLQAGSLTPGQWHLVGVIVSRCTAGGGQLYVDGQIVGTFTPRPGALDNTSDLFLGRNVQGGAFLGGFLDELEIFKRALLKSELDAIYAAGSAGKCKPPNCLVFNTPSNVVVTTCSNCAPAFFTVSATNKCCTKVLVACFPPSGSLFPLGTSTVDCIATDVCGNRRSRSFQVTVLPGTNCCLPPSLVAGPSSATASQGSTAQFSVTATGTPPLSYQWQRSGTSLPSQTSATLTLPNVQRSQAGFYSVVVSNSCGAVTSLVAQLVIGRPAVPDVLLTVEVSPAVRVGSNAAYSITLQNIGNASANGLVLTGYWATAQAGLQSGPAGCVFGFPSGGIAMTCNVGSMPVGGITNYNIVLSSFAVGGIGFSGAVSGDPSELNLANNVVTAATGLGFPPGIALQPASFAAVPGGAGGFSLMATGTPNLAYFWQRDGLGIGTNGPAHGFTDIHASDGGTYVCLVANPWGAATSAPVTLTLSYPSALSAGISSGTLRVVGPSVSVDLEIRLAAGDPTKLEVDNLFNTGTEFSFPVASFNKLVIELGDANNKLVFNDANGMVTALPKLFEIHGGAGSNLVVGSSTGINLAQLPALLGTLAAAPNFEALANSLNDQAATNILNPSIDLVGRLYTNMVLTAQMLAGMAQTNLAAQASNLVAQAQGLSQVASNCVNDALCKFADASIINNFQYQDFTNCLFQLIAQLETVENTLTNSDETIGPDPASGSGEESAENIDDKIESLIEGYEDAVDLFELGMDAIYDTGADVFYAKVQAGLEGPGEALGETNGPNFELLAEQFATLAEQLLEVQSVLIEAEADAMTTNAMNLEAAAHAVAWQAYALEQAMEAFTAAADPFIPIDVNKLGAAASIPTGTNAGCDRDITATNKVFFNIGGIVIGTTNADKIVSRTNTFLILALGGDDLIFGNTNFNIIFGGSGDDEIHGLAGPDFLFGGKGNDCIFGDEGFDLIFGGEGDDNLHGGTNTDLIIGWTGNDKIFGDDNADILIGWDGDDEMHGGPGIDVMFGGKGNDILYGGPGFKITNDIPFLCKFEIGNLMFGGDGDDKMYGSDGFDVMFGMAGNDEIYSSNQVDVVFGNAGNDKIYGGDGGALFYIIPTPGVTNGIRLGNVIFGGAGDDTIEGGRDIDVLFGGTENDNIRGSYSYDSFDYPPISFDCGQVAYGLDLDIIFGGDGDDVLDGGQDTDVIFGGKGNDILYGNGETNKIAFPEIGLLFGGPGNDTIIGGTNDILTLAFGRAGDDTIQGSKFGVMNLLFGGQDKDTIEGYGDLITLAFGGPDDDIVNGGGIVLDLLFGGPGNDHMDGKIGLLDVMFGNAGDDYMNGGISVLKLMFGNAGNDTMHSDIGVLNVMFGNDGCDTMYSESIVGLDFGNKDNDTLYGGIGLVEILFGNDGDDVIDGGGGVLDVIFGNAGNDVLYGGNGPNLLFGNSGNDEIHGGNFPDLIFGGPGNDRIYGGGGPDLIFGGKGDDCIDAGPGPDLVFGGSGQDVILGNDGIDLLFGGPDNDFIYGGSDTDLIFGGRDAAGDTIDGGPFNDFLFGQKGSDYLDGGGGKDRLWGGQDNDYLTARSGTDTRLRGNRGDDQFWINGGTDVRAYGGKGSDNYDFGPSGGNVLKKTSVSGPGSVSFSTPQPMCSEIHGLVWLDLNFNGVRDPGETGIPGVKVYLDLNNNGVWDANEPFTFTMADDPLTKPDETGMYWFTMLAPGTYLVREVVPAGTYQTYPPPSSSPLGSHLVSLGVMDVATNRNFGRAIDNQPPTVACGSAINVKACGDTALVPSVRSQVTAADDHTPSSQIIITQTPAAGTPLGLGSYTIVVTACDFAGNCVGGGSASALGGVIVVTACDFAGNCSTCNIPLAITAVPAGTPCYCLPPPSGMVLWLPFDEVGGAVAYNRAGGLNGSYVNNPQTTLGYVALSRGFNGTNQYVPVPHHGLIDIASGDFSIDAWVARPVGAPDTKQILVEKRGVGATPLKGYSLYLDQGRLWCALDDGATSAFDSGLTVSKDNNWHFVAVSVKRTLASGGRFYVDAATATFNPTARSGSLAHAFPLIVAARFRAVTNASLLAGKNLVSNQTISNPTTNVLQGWIDEVEVFNRAVNTEFEAIRTAFAGGKCKVTCALPAAASFCPGQNTLTLTATLCNLGTATDTLTYGFQGQATGFGCNVAGPTGFSPSGGTLTVAAGQCVQVAVTITRPPSMTNVSAATLVGCYKMLVQSANSGRIASCFGKVSRLPPGLCVSTAVADLRSIPVYLNTDGQPVSSGPIGGFNGIFTSVDLHNDRDTNVTSTLRLTAFAADSTNPAPVVSLNGQAPGTPSEQPLDLPPGSSASVPVFAFFTENDPQRFYTILIEADLDGDGQFEPLSSIGMDQRIQGRLDIELIPSLLSPAGDASIFWSGFGTLESAPAVAGPWLDVPGNPSSPHVTPTGPLPLPGAVDAPTQFFRLRQ